MDGGGTGMASGLCSVTQVGVPAEVLWPAGSGPTLRFFLEGRHAVSRRTKRRHQRPQVVHSLVLDGSACRWRCATVVSARAAGRTHDSRGGSSNPCGCSPRGQCAVLSFRRYSTPPTSAYTLPELRRRRRQQSRANENTTEREAASKNTAPGSPRLCGGSCEHPLRIIARLGAA